MASSTEQINVRITGHDNTGRAWQSATRRVRSHQRQMRGYTRVLRNAKLQAVQLNASLGSIPAAGLAGAAAGFGLLAKSVFTASRRMDAFMNSMIASTGSIGAAKKEVEKIKTLSDRLGINFIATADAYKKFSIAAKETGMELQTSDRVFSSVATAAAAMGLSSENTRLTLKALEQMLSKANVQAEELRGQLGEHLPGAFPMAAKAMGLTTAEMSKMLEQGKILAVDLLPKLATVLQDKFESVAVRASKQAGAAFERMTNEWNYFLVAIGNTGVFDAMADGIRTFTGYIKDLREVLKEPWLQAFSKAAVKAGKYLYLAALGVAAGIDLMRDAAVTGLLAITTAYVDFMNWMFKSNLKVSESLTTFQKVVHDAFLASTKAAADYLTELTAVDEKTQDLIESSQGMLDLRWDVSDPPKKPVTDDLFEMQTPTFDGIRAELMDLNKDIGDTNKAVANLGNSFATNLGRGLADAMATGKASFKDFAKSMLIDIAAMIMKTLILRAILASIGLVKNAVASFNMPSWDGSAITTPLSDNPPITELPINNDHDTFLNASQPFDDSLNMQKEFLQDLPNSDWIVKDPPGKAKGGSVSSRTPYMVGERGAELFVPRSSGTIVPNDKLGASQQDNSSLNITFQINAVDTQTGTAFLMKNQKHIVGMIDQAYRKQGRTGVTA
jgi:tape measure domain-containing protein